MLLEIVAEVLERALQWFHGAGRQRAVRAARAQVPRMGCQPVEIELPFQAGNVLRLAFATDGLGSHRWAWAAWAEPELAGELGD